ncbi:MAG: DUF2075 domain-containing protein [Leptospirales bacterium]|nr:DUF2075 domain-containing protein [Leptospirales bacterium]
MLIYQDTTPRFRRLVVENRIVDVLTDNYAIRLGHRPPAGELGAWQNSLSRVRDLIDEAGLDDNIIALEYEVPYNQSRIDCLIFGRGKGNSENVVLIELKQWSSVQALQEEGNFVETFVGGAERTVPHPSQQVRGYHDHLKSFVAAFEQPPPLKLFSCAYCHNYSRTENEGLFHHIYDEIISEFPIFTKGDFIQFAAHIRELLHAGKGFEVFNRFMQSPLRPSKKLLENVSRIVQNEAVFSLLNEQLVAKNLIWSHVRRSRKSNAGTVIIVQGGPGTGKSVIAINVLAEAARQGYKVFYGCKSKPFTEGLKKLVGKNGEQLFSNLLRFLPSRVPKDDIDLLLIDEAHRIETNSNHQYTKPQDRTNIPQIDQLIMCARTSVFFIDDRQNVRTREIGNSNVIRAAAARHNKELREVSLQTQFRCMGSNDYLLWLESVLGYSNDARLLRKDEVFDFRIFDSPQEIYANLQVKEIQKPNSARMIAGFCWPWSQSLDEDGEFVKDVRIGDFAMPWETHDKIRPPKGYVKWFEWAYRPEGFKQIGCIYTAQGFEFEYVGVIIGDDLSYSAESNLLIGNIAATRDPMLRRGAENFETHVKNIYRTLLSRGMKGCYVYFTNKETERYFRSRME